MEQQQITESKKRTLSMMQAGELAWKFKSKQDFVVYLDQHRKCVVHHYLTHLQYSITCLMRQLWIRTSSRMYWAEGSPSWRKAMCSTSRSPISMSCQFETSTRCSRRTPSSSNFSQISTPRIRVRLANTFSTSWQPYTLSILRIVWITPANKGCRCRVKTSRSSPSRSPSSGRKSSSRCRTLRVSCCRLLLCLYILSTFRKEWQDLASAQGLLEKDCRRA